MYDQKDKYDVLKLNNQLCFPLYAASREAIKLSKDRLDALDLTYTQYVAMLVLWDCRSATVKELGKKLYLDSGTLTPLLKKLESKGLISRNRSKEDERNLIVSLTKKGEELKETAANIRSCVSDRIGLNAEEAKILRGLLNKMLDHFNNNL